MEQFLGHKGILCPSCQYGIAYKYSPIVYLLEENRYKVTVSLHMVCPYCGESFIADTENNAISYNLIDMDTVKQSDMIIVYGI